MSVNPQPYDKLSIFNAANFAGRGVDFVDYPVAQSTLTLPNGVKWGDGTYQNTASGGGGAALTVEEIDGTPSVSNVTEIRVSNGTLTDNGGGVVTLTTGAGGGGVTNPLSADLDGGAFSITNVDTFSGLFGTFGEVTTETINDCYAETYHNLAPVTAGIDYAVASISVPSTAEGSFYFVSRCLDPGFKQTIVCQVIGFQNKATIRIINHVVESDTLIFTTVKYGTDGAVNFVALTCGTPSTTWEVRVYHNEDDKGTGSSYGTSFVPFSVPTPVTLTTTYAEVVLASGVSGTSGSVNVKDNVTSNSLDTVTARTADTFVSNILSSNRIEPYSGTAVQIVPGSNSNLLIADTGIIGVSNTIIASTVTGSANINLNVNGDFVGTAGEVRVTGGNMRFAPNPGDPDPRILDLGDPVDPQDAATKNYVDTTLSSGYVTNPMSSDLDCNDLVLDNVQEINDNNNLSGTIKMLGQMTLGTKTTGTVTHNFGTANNPNCTTEIGGNSILIQAGQNIAFYQNGIGAGTGYDIITQIQSPGGSFPSGTLGWQPAFGSPFVNPKFLLSAEKGSTEFKLTFNGQNEFFTNTTFTNPATTTTIPAADASIQIARASDAAGTVSGNRHYVWSEQGAVVGGGAAEENLCIGTNSQATDASVDTPAIIIDTVRKRLGVGIAPTEDFEVDGNIQIDSSSGVNSIKFYDSAGAHDHAQITAEDDGTNGGNFKVKTKEDGGVLRDGLIIGQDLSVTIPGVPSAPSLTTDATGKIVAGAGGGYTDAQAVNAVQTCATNPVPVLTLGCGFAFSPPVLAPVGSPPPMYVIPPGVTIVHGNGGANQITMPSAVPEGTVIIIRNENNINLEVFPGAGQVIENYNAGSPGTPSYVAPSIIGNFQSIMYYLADFVGTLTWYVMPRP